MFQGFGLGLALGAVLAAPAYPQGVIAVPAPPSAAGETHDTYGTTAPTAVVVGAYDCDPFDPAQQISQVPGSPNRFATGAMICPVMVPSGATLVSMELEACDTSNPGQVVMDLGNTTSPGGPGASIQTVVTGGTATPGCQRFTAVIPAATPAVDNATQKWFFQVITTSGNATQFAAARLFYRLNVAPAPATATFSDVPVGHPQMRFVEALVAAGITGGCGTGLYCPEAPVTRGQMAVFLSTALGLHFAP